MNISGIQSTNFTSCIKQRPASQCNITKEDIVKNDKMPVSMEDALIITGYTFDDDNKDLIIYPEVHYFKSNPINYKQ